MKKFIALAVLVGVLSFGFAKADDGFTGPNDISHQCSDVNICGKVSVNPLPNLIDLGTHTSRVISWKEYNVFVKNVVPPDFRDDNGNPIKYFSNAFLSHK